MRIRSERSGSYYLRQSFDGETDRERIKNFSKQEKQIYDDWRSKRRKAVSEKEGKRIEAEVEKMFALAFG